MDLNHIWNSCENRNDQVSSVLYCMYVLLYTTKTKQHKYYTYRQTPPKKHVNANAVICLRLWLWVPLLTPLMNYYHRVDQNCVNLNGVNWVNKGALVDLLVLSQIEAICCIRHTLPIAMCIDNICCIALLTLRCQINEYTPLVVAMFSS